MTNTNTNSGNLMAAATYFLGFITGIIFLLIEKKDQYIRFHAMQSTITFAVLWIVIMIISYMPFLNFLSLLLWPVELILWIFLMYKAYSGEKYKLPYIGDIAEQQLGKLKI